MDSDSPALGWGQSTDYPYQEGSFFGNIFTNPPVAYYCNGKDFDQGVVPGRLGATQTGSPYTTPYSYSGALCKTFCTAQGTDGFNSCPVYAPVARAYKHVVTVWRDFDPSTQYKVCNKMSGYCLDVAAKSTAAKAQIVQTPYASAASQKWLVVKISAGKYKLVNVNSSKALDLTGNATKDGTAFIQNTYAGTSTQIWKITTMGDGTGFYSIAPTAATTSTAALPIAGMYTSGAVVQTLTWGGADLQKWTLSLAN